MQSSSLTLSMNEILKDAQRIHEFRGDNSFALTSFLREVETVLALVQNDEGASGYIYNRIILNKIQGEALHVLRTLGPNPSWWETKEALINNFGIKESYHQLYQEAFGAKNHSISKYYSHLLSILCKINEKYEFDSERPIEFSPLNAEKIILRTFVNNVDVNLASVIINRNITKLRDAYNLLEQQGLIRNNDQKLFNNNLNKRQDNVQGVDASGNGIARNTGFSYSGGSSSRSHIRSNQTHPHRNYTNQTRNSMGNSTFRHDTATGQTSFHKDNYRRGNNSQMEVDHIDAIVHCPPDNGDHVNFLTVASRRHFQ